MLTRGAEPTVDGGAPAPAAPVPPAARRATGRRAALPNGRAVVGGLLVATAVVGTYAAWSSADDAPSTRYAVAARDLGVGEVLEAADLELVPMDAPASVGAAAFEGEDASLLLGQVTVAPLRTGDLVQRSAVVVPDGDDAPGDRQLSFPIDVSAALAGTIEEGERVDVLVTRGGDVDDAVTALVAEDATVARIRGDSDDGRLVILLSVGEQTDLLALTTAARVGELTLVRTTPG